MIPRLPRPDADSRVIDLADGRVLFLPSGPGGRAYQVKDYEHGWRLQKQLTWVGHSREGAVSQSLPPPGGSSLIQIGFGTVALIAGIPQFVRRRRVRREHEIFRVSGPPENKPIVPR